MHLSGAALGGILLGMFMAISVGPTLFAVLRYSLNHSYKAGMAFVLGVSLSDIIFVTIANVASPWLIWLHQFARPLSFGAAFILIVIGLAGFLKKFKPTRPRKEIIAVSGSQYFKIWLSGFLINTFNPALIFQWIAAATSLAKEASLYRFVFFGSCLGLVLGIDILKVFLADKIRRKLTLRRIMYLQKISALCLLAFGVAILIFTLLNVEIQPPIERELH